MEGGSLEKTAVWRSEIQKHLAASLYFAGLRQEKSTKRVPVCMCECVCAGMCATPHARPYVTGSPLECVSNRMGHTLKCERSSLLVSNNRSAQSCWCAAVSQLPVSFPHVHGFVSIKELID